MPPRRAWRSCCRLKPKWRRASRCIGRVRALKPKDAIEQTFKQDLIEKFEDGGATLPPDKRKRAQEIADEIERLGLQFSKNVNEDPTTVVLTPAEAAGMPDAWLAARKRDANGNLVLGLDYPTVVPFHAERHERNRATQGMDGEESRGWRAESGVA